MEHVKVLSDLVVFHEPAQKISVYSALTLRTDDIVLTVHKTTYASKKKGGCIIKTGCASFS